MAANQAMFNNYLRDVLLIENLEARQAINNQGITAFDDLTHRTDKYVQEIFTKIRSPGGLIPNPAFVAPAAPVAGAAPPPFIPALIPNRGVSIGVNLELRVRQLRYMLFHMYRLQREFNPAQATLARLERAWALKERIERMKEATNENPKLDLLLKVENIRKTVEDIDEVLGQRLGAYGAPLSYLVRDIVDPDDPDNATDPGYGVPDAMSELIRRTRHDGDQYEEDNMSLWTIVRQITHGGPAWNWVKPYASTKDGRASYFALKTHYMGKSFQKRNVAHAERILSTVFYDGKSRNFTFEMFCEKLNLAFLDLEEAGELVTEERKVRILLENTRAPELAMSVERIQGDGILEETFEKAMNYLAEQVDKKKQMQAKVRGSTRQIAAVNTGSANRAKDNKKGGKGGKVKGKSGGGKGTYLPYKEWSKLSKEQQEAVRAKRQKEQTKEDKRGIAALNTEGDSDDESQSNKKKRADDSTTGDRMSRR